MHGKTDTFYRKKQTYRKTKADQVLVYTLHAPRNEAPFLLGKGKKRGFRSCALLGAGPTVEMPAFLYSSTLVRMKGEKKTHKKQQKQTMRVVLKTGRGDGVNSIPTKRPATVSNKLAKLLYVRTYSHAFSCCC